MYACVAVIYYYFPFVGRETLIIRMKNRKETKNKMLLQQKVVYFAAARLVAMLR